MEVRFERTGHRRYAVAILRDRHGDLRMDPAPGYSDLIPHDLVHLVVEEQFGLRHGIFGQLAAGGNAGTFVPTEELRTKAWARVRADKAAAALAAKKKKEAEAEAAAIAAQQAADQEERDSRADLVKELQRNVTKHARRAVADDLLEGPILRTACTATGGGSTDDLTALTGTFQCLAVSKENPDGTFSGYGYDGTIDWNSGRMTWQIQNNF